MKKRRGAMGINGKIFLYLFGFCAVLLLILWLFQVVFLDSFYKAIQTTYIKSTTQQLANQMKGQDLGEALYKGDVIEILNEASRHGNFELEIRSSEGYSFLRSSFHNDLLENISWQYKDAMYVKALENGGSVLEKYIIDDNVYHGKKTEIIIYAKTFSDADGADWMILSGAKISPLSATAKTIQTQLIYVTGCMIVLSLGLAGLISRYVSRPIEKINSAAKELGKGNYDIAFPGEGYREISELSETLSAAAAALSKIENLRREFIANISHDLRTPLTLIAGYSEMMRDLPGEASAENMQVIIDEAKRLTSLVSDLLELSKFQAEGGRALKLSRFSLTEEISGILGRFRKLSEHDGYQIEFEYADEIFVYADKIKISQVVYNLMNNALTHTGQDRKVLVRQRLAGSSARVEIIDTGEGIPPESLPYIWDRYYKVDEAHKRNINGSGLGLSIVKSVLDMHGAKYGVASSPKMGSVFWFELVLE
ncbi:MAG: HAMP domain-containing histidine kinase [Oscillospiraceae bacterium]|nr:HAMP domain-containing histidine kinase [Oscillospiraceae bacterium]